MERRGEERRRIYNVDGTRREICLLQRMDTYIHTKKFEGMAD